VPPYQDDYEALLCPKAHPPCIYSDLRTLQQSRIWYVHDGDVSCSREVRNVKKMKMLCLCTWTTMRLCSAPRPIYPAYTVI